MKLESIFYIVGGIFAFAAIIYFSYEYLISFSRFIKVLMLVCVTVTLYFASRELHRRDI
ncbi:MAG: hypothetical protein WC755_01155 [Candidatus Woesearchaeota archaeon]|jgi:hypothetical protein